MNKKRSEVLQMLMLLDKEINLQHKTLVLFDPLTTVQLDLTSNDIDQRKIVVNVSPQHFKTMIRNEIKDLEYRFNQVYKELEDYTT